MLKYSEPNQRILKRFVEHQFCILKQQKQDREINQSADCKENMS